jgi:hypothetical protein
MQGRYHDLTGLSLAGALITFLRHDADHVEMYPNGARFYTPSWRLVHACDTPPTLYTGWESYRITEDGHLTDHATNFDSGD